MVSQSRQRGTPLFLNLTPPKIRQYLQCPQQFKLINVDRHWQFWPQSPALAFGTSIHAALEEIHRPNRQISLDDLRQIPHRHWEAKAYGDKPDAKKYFEEGLEILSKYISTVALFDNKVIGVNGQEIHPPRGGFGQVIHPPLCQTIHPPKAISAK